ncbi:MAG: hypothetical protein Q4C87_12700 [Actinomycetaceae bacterium]|nr:hypothetical protein [Actinomycetaceae bacterium]
MHVFGVLFMIVAVIVLIATAINPKGVWEVTESWKYKDPDANEPSEIAFAFGRISAIITLLVFVVAGLSLWGMTAEREGEKRESVAAENEREEEKRASVPAESEGEAADRQPKGDRQKTRNSLERLFQVRDLIVTDIGERDHEHVSVIDNLEGWIAPTSVIVPTGQQNTAAYDHVDAYLTSGSGAGSQEGVAKPHMDRSRDPGRKADFILVHRLDLRSDTTIRCYPVTYSVTVEADRIVVGFKECPRKIRGGQLDNAASADETPSGDAAPSGGAVGEADGATSASGQESAPMLGRPEDSEILLLGIDLHEPNGNKEIVGLDGTPIPVTVIPQDIAQQ